MTPSQDGIREGNRYSNYSLLAIHGGQHILCVHLMGKRPKKASRGADNRTVLASLCEADIEFWTCIKDGCQVNTPVSLPICVIWGSIAYGI